MFALNAVSRGGMSLTNLNRLGALRSRVVSYAKSASEEQRVFWEKNHKLNRPVSPHLTIYNLPLTAKMSVTHRITGAALSGVVILLGLGSFHYGGGNFDNFYQLLLNNVHPHVMLTAKVLLAFPLTYHTLAGVRHLVWDTGRGVQLPAAAKSGYLLIALAILSALALATA